MMMVQRGLSLVLLLASLLVPLLLRADGGVVRLRQASGPFVITVFTAAATLRTGPADVSVMVQDRKSRAVILDATVVVKLKPLTGTACSIVVPATSRQATNKLLKAAVAIFPSAGPWLLTVTVQRGPEKAIATTRLQVAPPLPRAATLWLYLALPPLAMLLFAANQVLRHRAHSRTGARSPDAANQS